MSALSVDVENEFKILQSEAKLLERAREQTVAHHDSVDEAMRWLQIAGLAAACEKLYSGCERIMTRLVRVLDGDGIDKTESWHKDLLNRISNAYPGKRDAIISPECAEGLDRFRSFRHRVRQNYGIELDEAIVLERASELTPVLDRFYEEVTRFLKHTAPRG